MESNDNFIRFEMAVAGAKRTNELLAKLNQKYDTSKALPQDMPFVVGHTLIYGPAGCGKTRLARECIKAMGCTEENKTYVPLSADSIRNTKELISILQSNLTWEGYLCNNHRVNHKCCYKCEPKDAINPRAPIKQVVLFIDEIHNLSKEVQEALLLILEDFRYQYNQDGLNYDVRFPKFCLMGATTDPGLLIKPLISRFKLKLTVSRQSDEIMVHIVRKLAQERGLLLEDGAIEIISKISQGVPREARNHIEGIYNCWSYYLLKNTSGVKEDIITTILADYYRKLNNFQEDGTSQHQINVLSYLNKIRDNGKHINAGVNKLCNSLGFDSEYYLSFIEPRLILNEWIDTTQARKITKKGIEYLLTLQINK